MSQHKDSIKSCRLRAEGAGEYCPDFLTSTALRQVRGTAASPELAFLFQSPEYKTASIRQKRQLVSKTYSMLNDLALQELGTFDPVLQQKVQEAMILDVSRN